MIRQMDSRKLALLCRQLAEDKKAEQVVVLDLRKVSSVADYFVIATGTSEPHLRAIVEEISGKLEMDHAISPHAQDGHWRQNWVVLDYFDVVVHLMRAETRERYALEQLWGDAPRLRTPRKPKKERDLASN
jgi:ribosome-associated protein